MVFSSVEFLFLFLPAFLLVQVVLPWKNLSLVLFSLFFYFVGEGWFSALIIGSFVMNYCVGLAVDAAKTERRRKAFLTAGVTANLALLIAFKYTGFIAVSLLGLDVPARVRTIHLPLGISFFTFHAISYLVDVYRLRATAERSVSNLAVYIFMFPQLIAGPIVRYSSIAAQLRSRTVTARHVFYGLSFFAFGLGQKVVIADTMGGIANPLFSQWASLSMSAAWIAVVSYTFQIYFDFGGYSNMAIGLAFLLGFDFPQNFNCPYISQSVTEFWRRWHMSLSAWFRDYLYISLGGNRSGTLRTYRNLFTVFLLCGLWHGASWTFALWGLYHGLLLVIERVGLLRVLGKSPAVLRHCYAMLTVMIGWVLFRSDSLHQALGVLGTMFLVRPAHDMPVDQFLTGEAIATLVVAVVLSTPAVFNALESRIALPRQQPWPPHGVSAYLFGAAIGLAIFGASVVKILAGSYSPFIYFRF